MQVDDATLNLGRKRSVNFRAKFYSYQSIIERLDYVTIMKNGIEFIEV